MTELLHDTHIWFAASFAVFVVAAFFMARKAVVGILDSRIATIRADIKTAEDLFAEAGRLLAEYEQKHADAVRVCAKIRADAETDAANMRKRAEADMAEIAGRRERQVEERLSRMKQSAIAEIQQYAADLAAAAAAEIIARKLDRKTNETLVDRAVEGAGKNLH